MSALFRLEVLNYMVVPSVNIEAGDAEFNMAAGFMGGDEKGTYCQYSDNSYISLGMTYEFYLISNLLISMIQFHTFTYETRLKEEKAP